MADSICAINYGYMYYYLNMSFERKLTKYERAHIEQPYFLERYFQKKSVWIGTLVLLAPFIAWGAYTTVLDLFKIVDDSDFGFYQDLFILFSLIVGTPFVVQEYKFYNKHLWAQKNPKVRSKRSVKD